MIALIVLRIWNCSDLFDCVLSVSWMSIILYFYSYYDSYCILCMIAWICRWQHLQIVGVLFLYSMSILICEVSHVFVFEFHIHLYIWMYYVRKSIGTLTTGDPWNSSYHYVCPTQLMPDDSPIKKSQSVFTTLQAMLCLFVLLLTMWFITEMVWRNNCTSDPAFRLLVCG